MLGRFWDTSLQLTSAIVTIPATVTSPVTDVRVTSSTHTIRLELPKVGSYSHWVQFPLQKGVVPHPASVEPPPCKTFPAGRGAPAAPPFRNHCLKQTTQEQEPFGGLSREADCKAATGNAWLGRPEARLWLNHGCAVSRRPGRLPRGARTREARARTTRG